MLYYPPKPFTSSQDSSKVMTESHKMGYFCQPAFQHLQYIPLPSSHSFTQQPQLPLIRLIFTIIHVNFRRLILPRNPIRTPSRISSPKANDPQTLHRIVTKVYILSSSAAHLGSQIERSTFSPSSRLPCCPSSSFI